MKTIQIMGRVDEHHRLSATVPDSVAPGEVKIALEVTDQTSGEDDAGRAWALGIAKEWAAELNDPREDIYTLQDGEPVNGAR